MRQKVLLGAQAALLATIVGLTLPGCFTVGDDDSGDAGSGGESGDNGKGGTGGSSAGTSSAGKGGSSGTAGTGGGPGPACVATGDACALSTDCCSFTATHGVCVDGSCADGCEFDSDCVDTGCCAELQSGGSACGPAEYCPTTCLDDGETCSVNSDCCSYNAGAGYCISDLSTCVPSCATNEDCDTGCCVSLQGVDDGACAPAEYCQ